MMTSFVVWAFVLTAVLWFMFAFLYRDFRVDLMRQRLFQVRDDLFSAVADSSEVQHDHDAHVMLRSMLNGMIRFSHELTFFRVVAMSITGKQVVEDLGIDPADEFASMFDESLEKYSEDTQKIFSKAQSHAMLIVFDHLGHTSIFLAPPYILAKTVARLMLRWHSGVSWLRRQKRRVLDLPVTDIIEREAHHIGSAPAY
ncbi:MAG: hypothetical protein AB8G18_02845 [Gammaproteobacteria bacterium]